MADKQAMNEGRKDVQRSQSPQGGGLLNRRDPWFSNPRDLFAANPFSMMRRMSEEMDRMFDEFGFGRGQGGSMWSPAVEVAERDGKYMIHADLPGLKPEEVKVELTEDALVIEGERKSQHEDNQGGVHRSERHYGHFYRAVPLPEGVDPEQVKARFDNGVLEVTMPAPQARTNRRQIPIEGGSQQTKQSQDPKQKNAA